MREFFVDHIGLVVFLWIVVYVSDYYLTIYQAKQFKTVLKDKIGFEGSIELTPNFQADVDRGRLFSRTLIVWLAVSSLAIILLWWLAVGFLGAPQAYLFALGALFLREAAVYLRFTRNIGLALLARDKTGIQGKIVYARWFSLRLSAVELISVGGLFFLFAILYGSWFFSGGALACMFLGARHWRWAKKFYPSMEEAL